MNIQKLFSFLTGYLATRKAADTYDDYDVREDPFSLDCDWIEPTQRICQCEQCGHYYSTAKQLPGRCYHCGYCLSCH